MTCQCVCQVGVNINESTQSSPTWHLEQKETGPLHMLSMHSLPLCKGRKRRGEVLFCLDELDPREVTSSNGNNRIVMLVCA